MKNPYTVKTEKKILLTLFQIYRECGYRIFFLRYRERYIDRSPSFYIKHMLKFFIKEVELIEGIYLTWTKKGYIQFIFVVKSILPKFFDYASRYVDCFSSLDYDKYRINILLLKEIDSVKPSWIKLKRKKYYYFFNTRKYFYELQFILSESAFYKGFNFINEISDWLKTNVKIRSNEFILSNNNFSFQKTIINIFNIYMYLKKWYYYKGNFYTKLESAKITYNKVAAIDVVCIKQMIDAISVLYPQQFYMRDFTLLVMHYLENKARYSELIVRYFVNNLIVDEDLIEFKDGIYDLKTKKFQTQIDNSKSTIYYYPDDFKSVVTQQSFGLFNLLTPLQIKELKLILQYTKKDYVKNILTYLANNTTSFSYLLLEDKLVEIIVFLLNQVE